LHRLLTPFDKEFHTLTTRLEKYYLVKSLAHWCFITPPGKGAEYCDQFVCVWCVCLSVREHIPGTAGPIFTKFYTQKPCSRGWILLWRRCDTLCTSGFIDDVMFGRNEPYGDAWKAEPNLCYH